MVSSPSLFDCQLALAEDTEFPLKLTVLVSVLDGAFATVSLMLTLAGAFYGRAAAYDAAFNSGERAKLIDALRRNVFAGEAADYDGLARHVEALRCRLAHCDLDALLGCEFEGNEPTNIALGETT